MSGQMSSVWIPGVRHYGHFFDRSKMRSGREKRFASTNGAWPSPKLPVTWYDNLKFPLHANDVYGICGLAMAAHADETFTGANGSESSFDDRNLIQQYFAVAGGDNGMTESQVTEQVWKPGLGGNASAVIYDHLDIEPSEVHVVQSAIFQFGGICLALSLSDEWIYGFSANGDSVWDAPTSPNPAHGHFVWINGIDVYGRYRVQTWGSWCWLTQAGMQACQPDMFAVFSPRWFGPKGYDPTGATYQEKVDLWRSVGGNVIQQPGPVPVTPVLPPLPPQPQPQPPAPPVVPPLPPAPPVPVVVPPPGPGQRQIYSVSDMIGVLSGFNQSAPCVVYDPPSWRFPVVMNFNGMAAIGGGDIESLRRNSR